jgi:hypothetical protein
MAKSYHVIKVTHGPLNGPTGKKGWGKFNRPMFVMSYSPYEVISNLELSGLSFDFDDAFTFDKFRDCAKIGREYIEKGYEIVYLEIIETHPV